MNNKKNLLSVETIKVASIINEVMATRGDAFRMYSPSLAFYAVAKDYNQEEAYTMAYDKCVSILEEVGDKLSIAVAYVTLGYAMSCTSGVFNLKYAVKFNSVNKDGKCDECLESLIKACIGSHMTYRFSIGAYLSNEVRSYTRHVLDKMMVVVKRPIVIHNREQFDVFMPSKFKKEQMNIHKLTCYTAKSKIGAQIEVASTSTSRIFSHAVIEEAGYKVRHKSKILEPKAFSNTFLVLSIDGNTKWLADALFGSTVVKVQNKNGWTAVYSDLGNKDDKLVDLSTGKTTTFKELNNGKAEIHIYKGLAWTASSKRQLSFTMMKVNGLEGDVRFKILDRATLGALSEIYKNYGIDASKQDAVQKMMGYVGNVLTGSTNVGEVKNYIHYSRKWSNVTNELFLSKIHVEAQRVLREAEATKDEDAILNAKRNLEDIENGKKVCDKYSSQNTLDGKMFICADEMALLLSDFAGVKVTPESITGKMIQLRPGVIKASADIVSKEVFKVLVSATRQMCKAEGGNPDKDIYVHGDEDRALYIADKNCVKLDFSDVANVTMEILAFAKRSAGATSKQFNESVLYAGQNLGIDAMPLLYTALKNTVEEKLSALTVNKKSRIVTPEEKRQALEKGHVDDLITAIAPRHLHESKALYNSVWKQAINSVVDINSRMAADIKSFNRRLSSDPAFLLASGKIKGVLNFGEIFINDKRVTKTVMVKYPKMGLREVYASVNVTLNEIIKRCNRLAKNGTITQDEADAIIGYYRNCDNFNAILPARMVVAAIEAGLDFDYDGSMIVEYTKRPKTEAERITNDFVDMLHSSKMISVVIDTDPLAKETDGISGITTVKSLGYKVTDKLIAKGWEYAIEVLEERSRKKTI